MNSKRNNNCYKWNFKMACQTQCATCSLAIVFSKYCLHTRVFDIRLRIWNQFHSENEKLKNYCTFYFSMKKKSDYQSILWQCFYLKLMQILHQIIIIIKKRSQTILLGKKVLVGNCYANAWNFQTRTNAPVLRVVTINKKRRYMKKKTFL